MKFPRCIFPEPGEDRTWTKEKWKAVDSVCRKVERELITPDFEEKMLKSYMDMITFGTSFFKMD